MEPKSRTGPGLAKTRPDHARRRFVARRSVELVGLFEGPMRALVDGADVMSEGGISDDAEGTSYYGSTSLLLRTADLDGTDVPLFAAAVARDPHARLRALRIAHREAVTRAGGPIETISAEVSIRTDARGVLLIVEVSARVARSRGRRPLTRGAT